MIFGKRLVQQVLQLRAEVVRLKARIDAMEARLAELSSSAPATLAAQLNDLQLALDADRASYRRQFAKLYGANGHARRGNGEDDGSGNSELDAWLQHQRSFGGGS